MPVLGDVPSESDDTRVNGEIMYSFLNTNNVNKLTDNDRTLQSNNTVTNRLNMDFFEDDVQKIQDMNFTLISTLRATGATTSLSAENISMTTERFKDFRLGDEFGNLSLAISKVRKLQITFNLWDKQVFLINF